jgi:allantoin racemase
MKICVVTVAAIPASYNPQMTDALRKLYGHVVRSGTELEARGLAAAPPSDPDNLPDYRNHYFELLLKNEVVNAVITAEKEGFDAVVVNCFDDPGVAEARAIVGIPVFGICEPAFHFVCQLGPRFGALVPDLPGQVGIVERQIIDHGLGSRVLTQGVRKEDRAYSLSHPEAQTDPKAVAGRLAQQAEQLVREGADAILIACGGLGNTCDRAGLHRITVDGQAVPVVTPLTVALKQTEMMLDMINADGIPIPSEAHDNFRFSAEERERIQRGFGVHK